jgi:hypothetical protein
LTALAATPIAIANTQVSGLGTASVLNAGVALGVATLDAGGTVPLSQIPASIQGGVSYQGSWNASTNTPTLTSSVGSKGYYYVVSVAGATNLNGITDWLPGDWAIYNGTAWEKIDNTDSVASVNGYVGAVVLNAADVGAPPTTRSISTGTGLTGGGNLSADRTIAIDSTVATLTGTQTLTNKTINLASNTLQATSAEIAAAVTDETGTGALVFANSPTLVTPALGTPASGVVTNLTGTASININGTVGATTATTGAFTTLAASGAVTLSGGTANGVAFLNASKVLTTGSALTFNGTALRNTSGQFEGIDNLTLSSLVSATNATVVTINSAGTSGTTRFQINNTEQMRLTSTGLGIGTSSPAYKLDVTGTINSGASTATGYNLVFRTSGITTGRAQAALTNTSGDFWTGIEGSTAGATLTGSAAYSAFAGTFTNNPLYLVTNGVIRTTLDSSGNLGLGVTPSSWTIGKALQVNGASILSTGAEMYLSANAFYGASAWTYRQTDFAAQYYQLNGAHVWRTAPSGTAGNAITFTQAMTLDASGNLGIGTSSPATKLDVRGAQTATIRVGSTGSGGAGDEFGNLEFYWADEDAPGVKAKIYTKNVGNVGPGGGGAADLLFATMPALGSLTERMRLDSSGNLGLGVTPSAWESGYKVFEFASAGSAIWSSGVSDARISANMYYNGGYKYAGTGYATRFEQSTGQFAWLTAASGTAGNAISFSQVMTLDASGNLLVGTTSQAFGEKFNVTAGNQNGALIKNTQASENPILVWNASTSGDSAFIAFATETSYTGRGTINYNRGSGLVAYNVTSDYRAKDIYGPVADSGALIDSVPVYMGKMKGATQERPMFIAHETPAYAHTGEKDAVDADGNPVYQQMDASALIPVMWAEIQSLRARLAAANI